MYTFCFKFECQSLVQFENRHPSDCFQQELLRSQIFVRLPPEHNSDGINDRSR